MNVKITTILSFDGSEDELENFVADLGEVIIEWGYGNNPEDEHELKSLVLVENFDLNTEEEYEQWLEERVNSGAFLALPVENG